MMKTDELELDAETREALPQQSEYLVRELPPDEYALLDATPLAQGIGPIKPSASHRVISAQDSSGRIVGYWFVNAVLHLEPLWIADEHRGRAGLVRRMWKGVQRIMRECNAAVGFAVVNHEAPPYVIPRASKLGFQRVPGDLYQVVLQPSAKEE